MKKEEKDLSLLFPLCQKCTKRLPLGKGYVWGKPVECFHCGYINIAQQTIPQKELESKKVKLIKQILKKENKMKAEIKTNKNLFVRHIRKRFLENKEFYDILCPPHPITIPIHTNCKIIFGNGKRSKDRYDIVIIRKSNPTVGADKSPPKTK